MDMRLFQKGTLGHNVVRKQGAERGEGIVNRRQLFVGVGSTLAFASLSSAYAQVSPDYDRVEIYTPVPEVGTPQERYGRLIQSANLALTDCVHALPHPSLMQSDPRRGQSELQAWLTEGSVVRTAVRRQIDQAGGAPLTIDLRQNEALITQQQAIEHLLTAFGLNLNYLQRFAALDPISLEREQAWYADTYFDACTMAMNVQRDLALAQAELVSDPFQAACLRVLSFSADVQVHLAFLAQGNAHGMQLSPRMMGERLDASADAMLEALDQAKHSVAVGSDLADAWESSLVHEARIAQLANQLGQALITKNGWSSPGIQQDLDQLLALYRQRPTQTVNFAQSFAL
jgi:hypothetical protein